MALYAESAQAPVVEAALFGRKEPSPGPNRPKPWAWNLECERYEGERGSRSYPGVIPPPPDRSAGVGRSTVVCRERFLRPGLRSPADEAILTSLEPLTSG